MSIQQEAYDLISNYIADCKSTLCIIKGQARQLMLSHIDCIGKLSADVLFSDLGDKKQVESVIAILVNIGEDDFAEQVKKEVA